jgi:molecular chaperone GrpE
MERQEAQERRDDTREDAPGDATDDGEVQEFSLSEDELEALCRERVCPGCDVHQQAEDARLRAMAEAENVKKRLMRETEELRKYLGETVLADLLPVLDNLDLALDHAKNLEACKDFVTGVEMTRKIFLDTLTRHGLEPVGAVGEGFDPQVHEAVGMEQNPDVADNAVAHLVQRGYILKGRLLRPAKVLVNKLS